MASYRTLPGRPGNVSARNATPASASVLAGLLVIALTWAYLQATSAQGAFTAVVNVRSGRRSLKAQVLSRNDERRRRWSVMQSR